MHQEELRSILTRVVRAGIDFLVEVGPVHSPWFLAGPEDLLGVPVDVVTQDGLHGYVKEKVLDEARSL